MTSRTVVRSSRWREYRSVPGELLLAGTVQVDGSSTYYQTTGSCEVEHHTVVFLHGMASSSACWRDQIAAVGRLAYTVAVDLPGHGRSEGEGCADAGEYAVFLDRFLDALGVRQPVVLVGMCLGAAVALEFAARWPDRVAGLVLSGIADRFAVDEDALAMARAGLWSEAFWQGQLGSHAREEVARLSQICWLQTRPEVRYADMLACANFRAGGLPRRVRAPALVLSGTEDRITPPEGARNLCRGLGNSILEVVPGAGHVLLLEEPERLHSAVTRFLAAIGAPHPVPARML